MKTKEIKKVNGYWVDENNNKWDCDYYTEEQAVKYSGTLINCSNCINCSYCSDCRSCRSCSDCRDCRDCRYCSYCSDCRSCRSCSDFKSNPQRITSNKIGSRNSQTTYYWNEEKELIVCGCFKGTLQEFKDAVKKEHSDNEHSKAYLKWIEAVEKYKSLIK